MARTARALGPRSIARVLAYRMALRLRLHPVQRLRGSTPQGPFFLPAVPELSPVAAPPVSGWQSTGCLFGCWLFPIGSRPPDWHADPLSGQRVRGADRPWWQIPDFDSGVGDIKVVWELSRMDWALAWAQRARQGDAASLARLNDWLTDWCRNNPPYLGPNWKCGQECSIRVMHLAMVALILGQAGRPAPALRELVHLHLRRIAPTLHYAVGQDNNHGTSEAAALFIGGSWLQAQGVPSASRWARLGRRWLEERTARLISEDGSFSQHSLNYHRVLLDTCSMAEIWRRHLDLPNFSERLQARVRAAADWLRHLINQTNGDGPNLGANDGAHLLPLTETPYRDYRPCVQLATVLFAGQRACPESGPWDDALRWLGLPLPHESVAPPGSIQADAGGYVILRRGPLMVLLRYPRFQFRPSHADALHLDFWHDGDNLLRDAGSYGYNAGAQYLRYFSGAASHNTIQFDGRDQMPRLGRFLFGDWLATSKLEPLTDHAGELYVAAGYRDSLGGNHCRSIRLSDTALIVSDEVSGFVNKATLRWRLAPGQWTLDGTGITDGTQSLVVQASMPIVRCELVEGWESRFYLNKSAVPVLEVEVNQPGVLISHYRLAA
ncbi:MAG: hypothetical protein AMXMBFR6_09000 [Betaproteobacteria bacterium]